MINEYIGVDQCRFEFLFRASKDGFNTNAFHKKCDNKGPTLVIIKSKGYEKIFGGFAPCGWGSQNGYITDPESKSFLFSLTH